MAAVTIAAQKLLHQQIFVLIDVFALFPVPLIVVGRF
jgi:hypothetical protein